MAQNCTLWQKIQHQRGPTQFCEGLWPQNPYNNPNIANLIPINVVPYQHGGDEFIDFTNDHLILQRAVGMGRGIYTQVDLAPETQVFHATPFATAVLHKANARYCTVCHRVTMRDVRAHITCSDCEIPAYCSIRCKESHLTHYLECGSGFQFIQNVDIKCAIQMVLEAIVTYDSIHELYMDIKGLVLQNSQQIDLTQTLSVQINDRRSKLHCILRLQYATNINNANQRAAQTAYSYLMGMPTIIDKLGTGQQIVKRRFLKHLLTNFYYIVLENGFQVPLKARNYNGNGQPSLRRTLIYDTISFANHSCVPNVRLSMLGNIFVGTTNIRIQAGHQLNITYIESITHQGGNRYRLRGTNRRNQLLINWNFRCMCELCSMANGRVNFADLVQNWQINVLLNTLGHANFALNTFDNCIQLLWYMQLRKKETQTTVF